MNKEKWILGGFIVAASAGALAIAKVLLALAAEEFVKAKEASIAKIDLDIRQLQAQAQMESVRKWDWHLPANIVPQGSGLLFGLDKASAKWASKLHCFQLDHDIGDGWHETGV